MPVTLLKSEEEMEQLAQKFAICCHESKKLIIFLKGELGAGKTFFVRAFIKSLGFPGLVKSPTYTLMETYEIAHFLIYHLDLYRLQSPNEILDIGLCDEFEATGIWLIEWPERALNFLPKSDIVCHIDIIETTRQIQFFAQTPQGEQTLDLFDRYLK